MNENFNRQFLQIDFASLEVPEFFHFLQKAEFGAYLILRRYVWRSTTSHPLGLHEFYWNKQLLVASVENDLIARKMGINDVTRVSKYHKSLEDFGVIKRLRTGRANIFILGEWIDISEHRDRSKRLEWFYFDRKFGAPAPTEQERGNPAPPEGSVEPQNHEREMDKSDLAQNAKSDLQKIPNQDADLAQNAKSDLALSAKSSFNKEKNRETTVNRSKNPIHDLPLIDQPKEKTEDIAERILEKLGDQNSKKFFLLVASRIPEIIIKRNIAEILEDGADHPAKLFTFRMQEFAKDQLAKSANANGLFSDLQDGRNALHDAMRVT
jgi:hypothetical protein